MPTVAAGILLGPALPRDGLMQFGVPLLFIGFLVPGVKTRAALAAATVGGVIAVSATPLPGGMGLILGAVAGVASGVVVERRSS